MTLVFLSHDSSCIGGAQKCLLDLIKGIKQIHPNWEIYLISPGQGDLVEACQPYINGYLIVRMKWWLMEQKKVHSVKKMISYGIHSIKPILRIRRFLQKNKLIMPSAIHWCCPI